MHLKLGKGLFECRLARHWDVSLSFCSPSAARAVTTLGWVGPVFPTPPFSKAGWLSNSWSCQLRPKRCIAVKYTERKKKMEEKKEEEKLRGLLEMDKQISKIAAWKKKPIRPLNKNKRPVGEHTMGGFNAGRQKKKKHYSLTSNNFRFFSQGYSPMGVFFLLLFFSWKHSTDRGQTKPFQSILRNPVALSCFLGERCSLMCHGVCTQTATASNGAAFPFWHKPLSLSDKSGRETRKKEKKTGKKSLRNRETRARKG